MAAFTDQAGRTFFFDHAPQRIVSLVPSQTELLFSLGLEEQVVGITKFCIHPESWFRTKTRIGGTKQLNIEKIKSLAPTLIIANKEENVREQVEELSALFPVWVTDVHDLDSALQMIEQLGQILHRTAAATRLAKEIQTGFDSLTRPENLLRSCYLIWREPYMTAGGDTFIHDMMKRAGFENCFGETTRYPAISPQQLQRADPAFVLLSSEPYPFSEKHFSELHQLLPNANLLLVDGELFSWYGSRLLQAPAYFEKLRASIKPVPGKPLDF